MLRLWNSLTPAELLKKVFSWDYEKCTTNWSKDTREILGIINMQNHFTSKTPVNTKQVNISKSKRSLLVQFRTGVLPLRIETGRFHLIKDTSSNKLKK